MRAACGPENTQIEFYFSDASLPSDKKLLKQIRKSPEGFGERHLRGLHSSHTCGRALLTPRLPGGVRCTTACAVPIKVFANFRKVRALTRDVEAIAQALQPSELLVLSADGKQVRSLFLSLWSHVGPVGGHAGV